MVLRGFMSIGVAQYLGWGNLKLLKSCVLRGFMSIGIAQYLTGYWQVTATIVLRGFMSIGVAQQGISDGRVSEGCSLLVAR